MLKNFIFYLFGAPELDGKFCKSSNVITKKNWMFIYDEVINNTYFTNVQALCTRYKNQFLYSASNISFNFIFGYCTSTSTVSVFTFLHVKGKCLFSDNLTDS